MGSGLVCVIVGLSIWLGGLGFKKLLVAAAGTISGGICGFFIIGRNIMSAALLAGFAAVIATVFEKLFITIVAAGLAAGLGFAVLATPYIEKADSLTQYPESKISPAVEPFSMRQTTETVKAYTTDLGREIRQTYLQMPIYNLVIIAAVAVIFILGGFFLWRLTSALCCAALGTMLIFAGMILLLLYKGAAPISNIYSRIPFYSAAFTAMITFGTIEQLLLCKHAKKKLPSKKEANNNKEESSWRTT